MSKKGKLTLIAGPIDELGTLDSKSCELLHQAFLKGDVLCVEDEKPGRRRWLQWGLPREAIDSFVAYNEHTRNDLDSDLIKKLSEGKNVFLMSDGGTPGFCDPGRSLVEGCHRQKIPVTCSQTYNSLIPAVAMSGFTEGAFEFLGFPPKEKKERGHFFKELFLKKGCVVFMDTPYRLKKVLEELELYGAQAQERYFSLVTDINRESELVLWGPLEQLLKEAKPVKQEFLLVMAPAHF